MTGATTGVQTTLGNTNPRPGADSWRYDRRAGQGDVLGTVGGLTGGVGQTVGGVGRGLVRILETDPTPGIVQI